MGDIYRKCVQVDIWLGDKDVASQGAFVGIKLLCVQMAMNPEFISNYRGLSAADLASFDDLPPGTHSVTLEIMNLFERRGSRAFRFCRKPV